MKFIIALEGFNAPSTVSDAKMLRGASIASVVVSAVFFVFFGAVAVYLSWKSNTLIGFSTPIKIFFAFFAFFGNLGYIFSFFMLKLGMYIYIKQGCPYIAKST